MIVQKIAFANFLKTATLGTVGLIYYASDRIIEQLNIGNSINTSPTRETLTYMWKAMRDLALSLLTIALVIIALANIVGIQTDKYGLTHAIPKLIISILMTILSFIIIAFLLEFVMALQAGLNILIGGNWVEGWNNLFVGIKDAMLHPLKNLIEICSTPFASLFAKSLVMMLFGLILVVVVLYLMIIVYVRTVAIWFLVIVSPLAFLLQMMPFTEFIYKMWWREFWKYAFMGPMIILGMWFTTTSLTLYSQLNSAGADWTIFIMAAIGLFFTAYIPSKLAPAIVGKISGQVKAMGKGFAKGKYNQFKTEAAKTKKTGSQTFFGGMGKKFGETLATSKPLATATGRRYLPEEPVFEQDPTTGELVYKPTNPQNMAYERSVQHHKADLKDKTTPELLEILRRTAENSAEEVAILSMLARNKDIDGYATGDNADPVFQNALARSGHMLDIPIMLRLENPSPVTKLAMEFKQSGRSGERGAAKIIKAADDSIQKTPLHLRTKEQIEYMLRDPRLLNMLKSELSDPELLAKATRDMNKEVKEVIENGITKASKNGPVVGGTGIHLN